MARLMRRLATLATAAEAARRYAKKNPDQAARYLDQAAAFVDKQTKGKYSAKIDGVASKVKNVAGVPGGSTGTRPSANGFPQSAAGHTTTTVTQSATSTPPPVPPVSPTSPSAPTTPTPKPTPRSPQ
jgi:hypothetical protein